MHSQTTELPREQRPMLIHGHHEGYASWAQFLAIEAKLAANRTNAGARPSREGNAIAVSEHRFLRRVWPLRGRAIRRAH